MMINYTKKRNILLIINAALVLILVLSFALSPKSKYARSTKKQLLESPDAVQLIRIAGEDSFELRKIDSSWMFIDELGSLPADNYRVEAFLDTIAAIERMELVSGSKDKWEQLGLEGENSSRISIYGKNDSLLADFFLGSYAPVQGLMYCAPAGDSKAYTISSAPGSYINNRASSWLDLRVWAVPFGNDTVQTISIKGSYENSQDEIINLDYSITRSSSGWICNDGRTLDAPKVDSMIRSIANLRAEDYTQTAPDERLLITVITGTGTSLQIAIGEKLEGGRFSALSNQRSRAMLIPGWALNDAARPLEDLLIVN